MRHLPLPADAAKPSPPNRIGDLAAQAFVAKAVAVLQVQQPQQRVDRDRRTAKPPVKQRPPRRDEALVVQVGVDLGQLGGQALGLLG